MTTEQNQPQVPQAPMGPASQGQQQAHRRRRRRRKGKNNGQPNAQANGQPPTQQQKSSNRPKKQSPKFFSKNNGGAQTGNGQGNRRKNKQRRPQVFVGPMDHSYRIANGNVADAPPSTIQLHSNGGNGNGGFYAEALPHQPAPVREDAPTRIFCFIEDLFFLAKIQETARKLGVKVSFVKNDKESIAKLTSAPDEARPSLIVFDLNNANAKPLTLIPKIKAKLKRGTSVIGFLSHLQGDLKMKATEAGCDTVMPRSAFSQNLPNLLRRYGMEEEEELEYQPVSG